MCFFLRIRLRRFLISEPMAARTLLARCYKGTIGLQRRVWSMQAIGGGVTAARGPLESQVEVRDLAPEHVTTPEHPERERE